MADNLMMTGVLKSLGATLAFAAVVAAIEYAYRRVRARLDTTPKERMAGVEIHRHESGRLAAGAQFGLRWLRNLAILAAFYVFLPLFLTLLPWTEKLAAPLAAYFLAPLASLWTALIEYLPSAAHVLVVVIVARYLLTLLRFVARAVASGRIVVEGFYPDWAVPTYKILRALVVMLVFVDILPYLPGANSVFFQGVSILVGAMVTLGSSSAVSNAVSGTVLVYTRAFNVGDIVRIGDSSGRVLERTLLTTRLRTASNEVVTIPNGHVLSGGIVNYSSEAQTRPLRILVPVGIGYDVDWRTVHGLLLSAAGRTGEVLDDPEPFVRQRSLDSASVSYELIAHTGRPDCALQTRSELLGHVLDAFKEAGIEVLSPSYSAIRDGNPSTIPAPGPSDAGPGAATDILHSERSRIGDSPAG